MPVARIHFGKPHDRDLDAAENAAHEYLAALLNNGQLHDYFLELTRSGFEAFVELPARDSLASRFASVWVRRGLRQSVEAFGGTPSTTVFASAVSLQRVRWLYLSTSLFDRDSPVRSPDLEEPIPLYLLPISCDDRQTIRFWAEAYRACDRLWIGSGALEAPSYRQLADPRSQLAAAGRDLCALLEKATGKPTYFNLMRYYAHRGRKKEQRPCPLCGRPWAVPPGRRERFELRCDHCRLVSEFGSSLEGSRRASFGDFRRGLTRPRVRRSRTGDPPRRGRGSRRGTSA